MACPHFPDLAPEVVACSVCKHGLTPERVPKPDDWYVAPSRGVSPDPGAVAMEGVLSGSMCPVCFTSRSGIGCECSRLALYQQDWDEAAAFLESVPELATQEGVKFTTEEAAHVASSVHKRLLRRATAMSDEDKQDAVDGQRLQFGADPIKARWFKPRRVEPTHLPI